MNFSYSIVGVSRELKCSTSTASLRESTTGRRRLTAGLRLGGTTQRLRQPCKKSGALCGLFHYFLDVAAEVVRVQSAADDES